MALFSDSYRPRLSGVVHSVAALVRALRRRGVRAHLFAPAHPGYRDPEPDVHRLRAFRLPQYPDFPLLVPVQPGMMRRIQAIGPAVIHVHSPFTAGRLGLGAARALGVPLIFTHHTLYPEYVHYIPWIPRAVAARLVRAHVVRFCNRCDAVIAPSRAVRDLLRAQGVRSRIEVIPTAALDLEGIARIPPADRRVLGIPPHRVLLVYVGRLAREKNLDLLLEAFARACNARPLHLLLVGHGPQRTELERRAREAGILDRVTFAGALPHEEALAWMKASDVFVFASRTETQGLAVVEAMACGLPVTAVRATGTSETVTHGQTGLLVDPDPEALASAMARLVDQPGLQRELAEQARAAATQWSEAAQAERVLALYRSVQEG
ncbi:MAG: glycosyltransferase family 4 protein [Armatimonadota bacterium]|nr:glycosyltransferase family 4 protein [Armatimonadota bacterium]MDR7439083.1 glycosyltransferase family 4 protein [Armatimonadota bacterium]MDR7563524.1 glycosyltransferase family 4 protein [Armatimonadota bacterium]MDR7602700.1 glycosyltransferase family 4 protein [Armatimonadota bacterium]